MTDETTELRKLYLNRFGTEIAHKRALWKTLCRYFLQRYVPADAVTLDVGCGFCEFINNIRCAKKIALDLNPAAQEFADGDVQLILASALDMRPIPDNGVDVVFMSNFLEHMYTKRDVMQVLQESFRVLKPEGRLLIIQPNIRYAYREYWDYWDHHTPISDKSIAEAFAIVGFRIEKMIPRFLPYTTKIGYPTPAVLLQLYLKLPFLWNIIGGQMFCCAVKPPTS
jgi:ubiquinone/menaquinone biosynthesis C-methylase UbiE